MSSKDAKTDPGGFTEPMLPTKFGDWTVLATTVIGRRPNQEDRFVFNPNLFGGEYAFFGVYDGTVKEYASEWIHLHILPIFLASPSFQAFHKLDKTAKTDAKNQQLLEKAMHETHAEADKQCVEWCRARDIHYSSCTAVSCIIHRPTGVMYVAHLGDSHLVLGSSRSTSEGLELSGKSLTRTHKPDSPRERARIEDNGGSLVYLHGGKPFIRGGDFSMRTRAMQLNYSRAFGGKDLKMYGLSCVPSVSRVQLRERKAASRDGEKDVCIMLGSDGLWDVINPTQAVYIAMKMHQTYSAAEKELAKRGGEAKRPNVAHAGETLVQMALQNHEKAGSNDNVTVLAVYL